MFEVAPSFQREVDVALVLYVVGFLFLVFGEFVIPDPVDPSGIGLICILGGVAKFSWGLKKHHLSSEVS